MLWTIFGLALVFRGFAALYAPVAACWVQARRSFGNSDLARIVMQGEVIAAIRVRGLATLALVVRQFAPAGGYRPAWVTPIAARRRK